MKGHTTVEVALYELNLVNLGAVTSVFYYTSMIILLHWWKGTFTRAVAPRVTTIFLLSDVYETEADNDHQKQDTNDNDDPCYCVA